jgi:hypothetical protein
MRKKSVSRKPERPRKRGFSSYLVRGWGRRIEHKAGENDQWSKAKPFGLMVLPPSCFWLAFICLARKQINRNFRVDLKLREVYADLACPASSQRIW